MRWYMMVVAAVALVVATGAAAQRDMSSAAGPQLRHSAAVQSVEALTTVEVLAEAIREYEAEAPPPADLAMAEERAPKGYVVCRVKSAGAYHAVVTRARVHQPVALKLTFYDAEWELLGEVQGLPRLAGESLYEIFLHPNADGSVWAVVVAQTQDKEITDIGIIRPPELRFDRSLHYEPCGGADVVWLGGRVIIHPYVAPDENAILSLDPGSGKTQTIYQEEARTDERAPVGPFALSPDGRYVAFGRAPFRPNREYGLWLFDTQTGRCAKILYDDTGLMDCVPKRWDGPSSLIFLHTESRGAIVNRRWYRARLRLPLGDL